MRTVLEGLKGQPDVDSLGVEEGLMGGGGGEEKEKEKQKEHFDCVVIGGGQAGLSVAGRLKALGISYVVMDRFREVGDNWRMRYDSARCELV